MSVFVGGNKEGIGEVSSGGIGFLEDATWIYVGGGVYISERRLFELLNKLMERKFWRDSIRDYLELAEREFGHLED